MYQNKKSMDNRLFEKEERFYVEIWDKKICKKSFGTGLIYYNHKIKLEFKNVL
jgi:hypothetical protein